MAGAEWEAHNRQGDDALEWENEQIGTFPDVEVAQTAALVIAGKDPQLEAVLPSRVAGFVSRAEAQLYAADAECRARAVGYMLQQYDHVPRTAQAPKAAQPPEAPPAPSPAPKSAKRKKAATSEKAAAVASNSQ